jgi:plasmid stabilization system protein ParE
MRIQILDRAERDLIEGFHFYESQGVGLGSYFLANLNADIESLHIYAGIHSKPYKNYHRLLSQRFPFAVFYKVREETVFIHAILDCRREPAWIRARLR